MPPKPPKPLPEVLTPLIQRPPKKFQPSLVTNVYSKVSSHTDLDNLIEASYLENVLWKYFHADVTNSHIELILAVVFYGLVMRGSLDSWTVLKEDKSKVNELLQRVLQTTLKSTLEDQNVNFEYLTYLFLGCVVRYDAELLLEHELYDRWLKGVLDKYSELFLDGVVSLNNAKTAAALVYFLGVAKEAGVTSITDTVEGRCFLSVFSSCDDPQLAQLVRKQQGKVELKTFSLLQRKAKELGVDFLAFCILPYALNPSDVHEKLTDLELETLQDIAETVGYLGDSTDTEFLANVVIHNSIPQLDEKRYITETELFDLFNIQPTLSLSVPSFFGVKESVLLWKYESFASLNRHLLLCLGRLDINKQGIQGQSKYHSEVEKTESKGLNVQLNLKANRKDILKGDFVVIVQMDKPVKFEHCSRLCQYGLSKARLVKVTGVGPKTVNVQLLEQDHQYNGLFTLPDKTIASLIGSIGNGEPESLKKLNLEVNVDEVNGNIEELAKKGETGNVQVAKPTEQFSPTLEDEEISNEGLTDDQLKALREILTSRVSYIETGPHCGEATLVNGFLETILLSLKALERSLVILPTKTHVERFPVEKNLNSLTFKCGDIKQTRMLADHLLHEVERIASALGLHEYDFGSSLRHAFMFYESHVKPRWEEYLKTLKKTLASVSKYPFAQFQFDAEIPLKDALDSVVLHYSAIKSIFAQIQRLLPLDKANINTHPEEALQALCTSFPFVICSPESLHLVGNDFDNVISFAGIITEAVISAKTKRVSLLGDQSLLSLEALAKLSLLSIRPEIANVSKLSTEYSGEPYNPGLGDVCQLIKVPASSKQVNVEEGTYIVSLYQFMRLLGYRQKDISIVVTSPYVKVLIEEILEEKDIKKGSQPNDSGSGFEFGWPLIQLASSPLVLSKYVLFSLHGNLSFRDVKRALASASKGFYAFGSHDLPFDIPVSDLKIYTGASLTTNKDDREHGHEPYVMEGAEHMEEYVAQLIKARRGNKTKEEAKES